MPQIAQAFAQFNRQSRRAIMPFITAGDPDLAFTRDLLVELDTLQPGLFEIGFPYSDPIADGPVIQSSYTRALSKHIKVDQIFDTLRSLKGQLTQPTVAMVSFAIVLRYGTERFLAAAVEAGFSGLIVPDLLWSASDPLLAQCRAHDLHLIPLITPTTPKPRALAIAQHATGFIYYVSVAGVTGERATMPQELFDNLSWLQRETDTPICVGFGVSGPAQVEQLKPVCDGLIVGSAIMRRVAELAENPKAQSAEIIKEIKTFVASLIASA